MQRLEHIAIAVPDLVVALETYRNVFGATISEPQDVPEHGVRIVFVHLENAIIELMEPLGEESPIAGFLKCNPVGGIHHFCIGDTEFPDTIARMRHRGIRALGDPRPGAHGHPVLFLHPKDFQGTLIELEHIAEET